ncbi:MAG: DNA polymerase III subunit gamma/tau [Clostridia bacterium]|nr:DNA polymerase III subunit gamma/tau [Clostridia bacterium]
MAYLSLYRKFRPDGFDSLLGQDHIVRILKNQIATNTIGHAYLFTGARGTGKTSAAKIFARAVNCLSPVNGSPCGECDVCKALSGSVNLDILEIDAASNNGVDEIRDLRERIMYPPVSGKYKVYIVDEVHMLSIAAFNALLKTLEEPPAHAIFILATTEVQKIPDTILSRCMRFDFRLLPEELIASHLENVFKKIGKDADKNALRAIASAGEGSMRDALSVADMCLSYSTGKLLYEDVLEVLGATDRNVIVNLVSDMLKGNAKSCIEGIDSIVRSGRSMGVLARDLSNVLRIALVLKVNPNKESGLPDNADKNLRESLLVYDTSTLLRALELVCKLETEMRYSVQPRLLLEATALKVGDMRADLNVDGLLSRITVLENKVKALSENISEGVVVTKNVNKAEAKLNEIVPDDMGGDPRKIWARLVKYLRDTNMFALYTAAISAKDFSIENSNFIVIVDDGTTNYSILSTPQNVSEVSRLLTRLTGVEYKFVCKLPDGIDAPSEGDIERIKSLVSDEKLNIVK